MMLWRAFDTVTWRKPSAVVADAALCKFNRGKVRCSYHTQKPKNGLGNYRTIGRVSLHSDHTIVAIG